MPAASGTAAAIRSSTTWTSSSTAHRITRVEPHRAAHVGTVIDASNETVIPGLIEIHTHLSENFGEALGRAFLSWGITTVRNPATNTFETMEFREAFESGARVGPRLMTTGEPFDGTRIYYPGGTSLSDSGQVPLELQHAKDFGYDFIKTYVRLPDLMQKRIIEAAHAMGMPVTSHELYPAVAYGADGVEHIRGTSRRGYSPKLSVLARSYQDVIDLLTASKMTLTPTIGIQGGFRLQTLRDASWLDDPRMQALYPRAVVRALACRDADAGVARGARRGAAARRAAGTHGVSGGQRRRACDRGHGCADQPVRTEPADGARELRVGRPDAGGGAADRDDGLGRSDGRRRRHRQHPAGQARRSRVHRRRPLAEHQGSAARAACDEGWTDLHGLVAGRGPLNHWKGLRVNRGHARAKSPGIWCRRWESNPHSPLGERDFESKNRAKAV